MRSVDPQLLLENASAFLSFYLESVCITKKITSGEKEKYDVLIYRCRYSNNKVKFDILTPILRFLGGFVAFARINELTEVV